MEKKREHASVRRNRRATAIFAEAGMNVRIVGDEQKPNFILDDKYRLSIYASNFLLRFKKKFDDDDHFAEVNLDDANFSADYVRGLVEQGEKRPIWKIGYKEDLFLVGYNYKNQDKAEGRYPVFARFTPKMMYEMTYAQKIVDELRMDGYEVYMIGEKSKEEFTLLEDF